MSKEIIESVAAYYGEKIAAHGATPRGVDWNGEQSQVLRFEQLSQVFSAESQAFSLLDFGCGYGAMYTYLKALYPQLSYTGFDINSEMLAEARKLDTKAEAGWISSIQQDAKFDYVVASGVFNVKLKHSDPNWFAYICETLNHINSIAIKGFSFNVLTAYSDAEYCKDYLYYAEPAKIFDYCMTHYSKKVALLHDYPLYEFTVLVRK